MLKGKPLLIYESQNLFRLYFTQEIRQFWLQSADDEKEC